MKCVKCGGELPENTQMTMHLKCAQNILKPSVFPNKKEQNYGK